MDSVLERPSCVVWGCELNAQQKTFTFTAKENLLEHQLIIGTLCLGAESEDELNIVTLRSKNSTGNKPIPIASLRRSVLPMISISGIDCTPPVTFTLSSGSGPLYISGQYLILEEHSTSESGSEEP
ncbi:nucleoplasmin-like [Scyliorhinus torazame]|uniref:nucleoplasmin-like n=1 Tax=Scyliorhinus torazame TaxID=75743 RepID=UPI003B5B4085